MTASLPFNYGTDIFLPSIPQTHSHCTSLLLVSKVFVKHRQDYTVHILFALTHGHVDNTLAYSVVYTQI